MKDCEQSTDVLVDLTDSFLNSCDHNVQNHSATSHLALDGFRYVTFKIRMSDMSLLKSECQKWCAYMKVEATKCLCI